MFDSNLRAAVYSDNNFGSEIIGFKTMRVSIQKNARVIAAPVETGHTSFDNKVRDPTVVKVIGDIVIGDGTSSAISKLEEMFAERGFKFYSATDGVNYANNLILKDFPPLRDVGKYDIISVELGFVEAMLIQGQEDKTENEENSNTRDNGTVPLNLVVR
jgi:hypothetical protein